MEKGGKIGRAGILAGPGAQIHFFLSGAAGGLAGVGPTGHKGDMEKGRSDAREFWREWGPKVDFFLSGAAGVSADEGPVGHKRRHRKGKIGLAGVLAGLGGPKWTFF